MFGLDTSAREKIIANKCEEKLEQVYPAGIPLDVTNRFYQELESARKSDSIDELFIYHILDDEAYRLNMPLSIRGSSRNSILTFLLGHSIINPMKAHYYCKKCGHFEYIDDNYFAIDAANKECPNCKCNMERYGFSFDPKFVWGLEDKPKKIDIEYNATYDFSDFAMKKVEEAFKEINVNIGEVIRVEKILAPNEAEWTHEHEGYFAILPPGKTRNDYSEYIDELPIDIGGPEDEWAYCFSAKSETFKELGIPVIYLHLSRRNNNIYKKLKDTSIHYTSLITNALLSFEWGKFLDEFLLSYEEIEKLGLHYEYNYQNDRLENFNPSSIYEMCEALSQTYNTWKYVIRDPKENDGDIIWCEDIPKEKPFYSRDSLMHLLIENGIGEDKAYSIVDYVRIGKANRNPDEWYKMTEGLNIPTEIINACEECVYIFPQSHALEYLIMYALDIINLED